jgi:hypothetical protein
MNIHIPMFVVGVIATIFAELVTLIIAMIINSRRNKK